MDFWDDFIRTFKSNLGNELWDLSEARPSIEGSNSKLVRFSRFLGLSTEGFKKIGRWSRAWPKRGYSVQKPKGSSRSLNIWYHEGRWE